MNIWRLITHHEDADGALAWTCQNGRIAIGWGKIGDLRHQVFNSSKEVGVIIRRYYPELNNSGLGGISLWNFYSQMQKGDLVILSSSRPRELVVEVQGEYKYSTIPKVNGVELSGHYQHQRRVQVSEWNPEELWHLAGARPATGQNIRQTLIKCERPLTQSST